MKKICTVEKLRLLHPTSMCAIDSKILGKLGFESFDRFVCQRIGITVDAPGIFIKYTGEIPSLSMEPTLTLSQILSISLEQCEDGNQLCQGYNKSKKQWNSCNTSRNILKTEQWSRIFSQIGSEYSLFLLKNSTIVQKIGKNYILLCGNLAENHEKNYAQDFVRKGDLFCGRVDSYSIDLEEAIQSIIGCMDIPPECSEAMKIKIKKSFKAYQKLPLKSIFRSFIESKREISKDAPPGDIFSKEFKPELLADFLFMISKKFLRPLMDLRSFRILKGKLVLFLKRNVYETLNSEDLSKHFKTSHFKLFSRSTQKTLPNPVRLFIIKNLMFFLFESVYLKIISFFFYTTTASFSKMKTLYFTRIDWNLETSKFLEEHLKSYEKCVKQKSFATLRCVPKENGFRVITNCSRLSAYGVKSNRQSFHTRKRNLSFTRLTNKYNDISQVINNDKLGLNAAKKAKSVDAFKNSYNSSINSQVSVLFPIIKTLASTNLRFSLLRHFHIGDRLFSYLSKSRGRLILLKVDLARCFDNIPQTELLNVLHTLLTDDEYILRDMCIFKNNTLEDRVDVKYIKSSPEFLIPLNLEEAQKDEQLASQGITEECIIKEIKSRIICRSEVLKKLENLIKNTTVVVQNQHYRCTQGIPQGCVLSSLLCSVYFSWLDRHFPNLDWFIARFVDDFLIITQNVDHVTEFFRIARSLEDKGFCINEKKMGSNIDLDEARAGRVKFISDSVVWCGMRIYDEGLSVKSVCADTFFRHSVFIGTSARGEKVFSKIKRSFAIKTSQLFICSQNKKFGECVFDALYFVARRLKILALRLDFINFKHIDKILEWCVEELCGTVERRKMKFDRAKVLKISKNAFEKSGIRSIKRKEFN